MNHNRMIDILNNVHYLVNLKTKYQENYGFFKDKQQKNKKRLKIRKILNIMKFKMLKFI